MVINRDRYLNKPIGVSIDNILELALDEAMNAKHRNSLELD